MTIFPQDKSDSIAVSLYNLGRIKIFFRLAEIDIIFKIYWFRGLIV